MLLKENYSLRMTYVLSVLCGTWPLYPTKVHSTDYENRIMSMNSQEKMTRFRRYALCTIWLLIMVCSHTYYIIQSWFYFSYSKSTIKEAKYDEIAKILLVTENWTFNLAAIVNISTTYFTGQKISNLLYSCEKVERWIISTKGMKKTVKLQKSDLSQSIIWLLSIYLVIFTTMIVEYTGLLSIYRDGNFFNFISQDLGKLSMTTYDIQFSTFCLYLKNRFSFINEYLKQIESSNEEIAWNKRQRKLHPNCVPRIRFLTQIEQSPSIAEMNKTHMTLCDVIAAMNSIYQIQIALNLAVCFFNTVSVLFTTISEYRANTDRTLWISGLLWVTYYILRVVMVCTSASQATEQAYQPKIILSNINDQNLKRTQKYQLELFMQRLANTDIKFMLLNLITINTTFLSSAGVVVTTYLVIALQYTYT